MDCQKHIPESDIVTLNMYKSGEDKYIDGQVTVSMNSIACSTNSIIGREVTYTFNTNDTDFVPLSNDYNVRINNESILSSGSYSISTTINRSSGSLPQLTITLKKVVPV